ncbi:MAG TPA: hypothetical protein PLE74_05310 [Candidatus Cloacimonadota bacterium]|nr:hypothetical protein [Candidatus Cloacimonadota bacterium]HPT71679.1 hypothetical protein [Candidatus Cloacimonadota bacterium]
MRVLAFIWGFFAISGFLFGLIPFLGAWNWVNIPFSIVGLVIGIIGYVDHTGRHKNLAAVGIVLCTIAIVLGFFRLILGFGVL